MLLLLSPLSCAVCSGSALPLASVLELGQLPCLLVSGWRIRGSSRWEARGQLRPWMVSAAFLAQKIEQDLGRGTQLLVPWTCSVMAGRRKGWAEPGGVADAGFVSSCSYNFPPLK